MLPLLITAASLVPSIEELMLNQASVLPTEVSSVQMARAGANSHNKRITRARIRGFPPRRRICGALEARGMARAGGGDGMHDASVRSSGREVSVDTRDAKSGRRRRRSRGESRSFQRRVSIHFFASRNVLQQRFFIPQAMKLCLPVQETRSNPFFTRLHPFD